MCEKEIIPQRPLEDQYEKIGVETKLDNLPLIEEEIPNLKEDERIFLLHSEKEVREKVKEIGMQILEDYEGIENFAVLVIKEGGKRFADELVKYLGPLNPLITYIKLKSYTEENQQKEVAQLSTIYTTVQDFDGDERKVDILKEEFEKYHWLILDDVIDEASTIKKAKEILKTYGVVNMKIATMFNKNAFDIPDYCCFSAYWGFWLVGGNMGKGDDFTTLPTGPLSVGVYSKVE